GRPHRNRGGARGACPAAARQAGGPQRGCSPRGRPPRRPAHTRPRRMTRPYRLTPLPWQADPLPGLLAIRDLGHPVLLDSAASEDPRGHYSILAAGPIQLISAADNESGLSTIQRLRAALAAIEPASWPAGTELPFGAGHRGCSSYACGRALERIPAPARAATRLPGLHMGVYLRSPFTDQRRQRRGLACHRTLTTARGRGVLE